MTEKRYVLLSIKPKYANAILAGEKTVELRRMFSNLSKGDVVAIYSTAPISAVVGYFTVDYIDKLPIPDLWEKVCTKAMVTEKEYYHYFRGKNTGYGIYINNVIAFANPIGFGKLPCKPMQSYRFLDDIAWEKLKENV